MNELNFKKTFEKFSESAFKTSATWLATTVRFSHKHMHAHT